MKDTIKERIASLRRFMQKNKSMLLLFPVPTHMQENMYRNIGKPESGCLALPDLPEH